MTERKRASFQDGAKRIDEGLNALSSALGGAITDVLEALQDGKSGPVVHDHVVETAHGPVKAYAGLQVQVGGMTLSPDATKLSSQSEGAQPQNPDTPPSLQTLTYSLTEDANAWTLTAEIPGVSHRDLCLEQDETALLINTEGARQYSARADLGAPFLLDDVALSLAHGVLTLRIAKGTDA